MKECPSCAMEIGRNEKICPICGYEFPLGTRQNYTVIAALLFLLLMLIFLFF
jgi:RNA polymerase subunit RPABC4/transcription elongation factor Spt4